MVTEVMAVDQVKLVNEYADVLQVGARNMQNFNLLNAVGEQSKPVLLKRGMSATLEEFLLAAEYIMSRGNSQVMLCERGIRTYEEYVPQYVGPGGGAGVASGEPSCRWWWIRVRGRARVIWWTACAGRRWRRGRMG